MSALAADALAKRNALVLAGAQALGGAALSIIVATGGLDRAVSRRRTTRSPPCRVA